MDGLGTSLVGVEGETAAIQTQLVSLGVASVANDVFSFANAAGTLISSTVLTSRLSNYLPLTGGTLTGNLSCKQITCTSEVDTGSLTCTSLSVNGKNIVGDYLPLSGAQDTHGVSDRHIRCLHEPVCER